MIDDEPQMRTASLPARWGEAALSCTEYMLALLTRSVAWDDMDRDHIAIDAARGLAGRLDLEFAAVELTSDLAVFRHSASNGDPSVPSAALLGVLHDLRGHADPWPIGVFDWQGPLGSAVMRIVRIPIGLRDAGWVFAGSVKDHFPRDSDFVILTACANLIAVALEPGRRRDAPRESDGRFERFAAHAPGVLWILDVEQMEIEYLSPAFARIWGQKPESMLGKISRWADTIHAGDRGDTLAALESVIRGEIVTRQYRIVGPNLIMRRIRHVFFPIRDDRGNVTRVGGVAEDLTRPADLQVYVMGSDGPARNRMVSLLHASGYDVKLFTSSHAFLEAAPVLVPGCMILERRGTETGALRLVRELKARRIDLPIIIVDDRRGDVGAAVAAMKAGATDWLEAPYGDADLLAAVASALAGVLDLRDADQGSKIARTHVANMTTREREVLRGMVSGETNKEIARRLGISPRTVEAHRAHVMERLGVKTLPEAVLLVASIGLF